jgi:uncharacterized protein (TIRG00374 family)
MSRKLRSIVGVLLSLLLLWWALRDVSPRDVIEQIGDADFGLIAISVAVALAGFFIRAFRWGILLLPVTTGVPFSARLAATFIGFAANNVLPARVGEFARAFSLSRLAHVPPAAAFATLVVERLLDGLVLVALMFAAMAVPSFPTASAPAGLNLQNTAATLALLMLGVAAFLFFAVARPRRASQLVHLGAKLLPRRFRPGFVAAMRSFSGGLMVLKNSRLFAVSFALAAAQWVFLATSYLLAFRAFGIDNVGFSGAVFLQSLIGLAVAVPSSPGFFGPFEAAARLGLGLWNVPANQAISFAIGYHLAGFLPVTLVGVYYVWRLNLSWSEVRESEEVVEDQIAEPAATSREREASS